MQIIAINLNHHTNGSQHRTIAYKLLKLLGLPFGMVMRFMVVQDHWVTILTVQYDLVLDISESALTVA